MGLDQYAYAAATDKQYDEYWEGGSFDDKTHDYSNPTVAKPREIAYWRKHPNLHGWMEELAEKKGLEYHSFNGIEVELTWEDVDQLEKDIKSGVVASMETIGPFFGNPSDDFYYENDLQFCVDAKAELFLKRKVFYNSSW